VIYRGLSEHKQEREIPVPFCTTTRRSFRLTKGNATYHVEHKFRRHPAARSPSCGRSHFEWSY